MSDRAAALLLRAMYRPSGTDEEMVAVAWSTVGMPRAHWIAALAVVCGDQSAREETARRLANIANQSQYQAVRERAHALARLVMAEDATGPTLAKSGAVCQLLECSEETYQKEIRAAHMELRGRLDRWVRSALARIG